MSVIVRIYRCADGHGEIEWKSESIHENDHDSTCPICTLRIRCEALEKQTLSLLKRLQAVEATKTVKVEMAESQMRDHERMRESDESSSRVKINRYASSGKFVG